MGTIQDLLKDVSTLAVVCTQWGDTGKGKIVDHLADVWADIIARGTGGANAGHTIVHDGKTYVFHLVPSGILHAGKPNIIGSGVAFDPRVFCEELEVLQSAGLSHEHLFIALNARLVLPQHLLIDRLRESARAGEDKIGTTGRGIGPAYSDHVARIGLTVNDLLNPDVFRRKLKRNLDEKVPVLQYADRELVQQILAHGHLENGRFWHPTLLLDTDAIVDAYREYGLRIAAMIRDTDSLLRNALGKKNILLEGAQGNLLSIDYGTYPFVTSSDCSVQGLARGVGLRESDVDLTLGIVKGLYMTRVGAGPFPTEMGAAESDQWCNDPRMTEAEELERYPDATVNDTVPFEQGIGIRRVGNEYGSTTRRPRRVGWLDLPLLRYSLRHTGPDTVFTKVDVLDGCKTIRVCTSYRYDGPDYRIGGDVVLSKGDVLMEACPDYDVLQYCVPLYSEFEGWCTPTSHIRCASELPPQLLCIIRYVAEEAGLRVAMLSVGPDRAQTIIMDG